MGLFSKIFKKNNEITEKKQSDDILHIARKIENRIDKAVNGIFLSYRSELITQPIVYIVPAAWGASQNGPLTETQKKIFEKINPVIDEISGFFESDTLTEAEKFALGYVLRGLIISKITYMIEAFKNQYREEEKLNNDNSDLMFIEPIGSA